MSRLLIVIKSGRSYISLLTIRYEYRSSVNGRLDEFGDDGPNRSVEPLETFAIVTTEPNDLVADLHHRAGMLPGDAEREWSTVVNDPANDSPALIEPVV